jgi:hypothetical protein
MPHGEPSAAEIGALEAQALAAITASKAPPDPNAKPVAKPFEADQRPPPLDPDKRTDPLLVPFVAGSINTLAEPAQIPVFVDQLRSMANISDGAIADLVSDKPLSAAEHKMAASYKARLMNDREWSKKYLSGDQAAVREMTLCNMILVSEVAK